MLQRPLGIWAGFGNLSLDNSDTNILMQISLNQDDSDGVEWGGKYPPPGLSWVARLSCSLTPKRMILMAEDHSGTELSQLMSDTQTQLPWHHLEIWYKQMTHFVEEAWGAPWPCCSAHSPPSTWKSCIATLFPLAEVNTTSAKVGGRHTSYRSIWVLSDVEIFEMFNVLFLRSYL